MMPPSRHGADEHDEVDVPLDAVRKALFAAPASIDARRGAALGGVDGAFDIKPDMLAQVLAKLPKSGDATAGKRSSPLSFASIHAMGVPSTMHSYGQHVGATKPSSVSSAQQEAAQPQHQPPQQAQAQAQQVLGGYSFLSHTPQFEQQQQHHAQRQVQQAHSRDVSAEERRLMEQILNKEYETLRAKLKRPAPETKEAVIPALEPYVGKRKRRRKQGLQPGEGAKAFRYPPTKAFAVGLERPLLELSAPGGPELDSLKLQKLKDATALLQESNQHILEPLTLYKKKELFELFASIAEVWKNSGKAAWKKRINKIKENARYRKAPRNGLDAKEIQEIAELQARIKEREEWEEEEKLKLKLAKGLPRSASSCGSTGGDSPGRSRSAQGDACSSDAGSSPGAQA